MALVSSCLPLAEQTKKIHDRALREAGGVGKRSPADVWAAVGGRGAGGGVICVGHDEKFGVDNAGSISTH